MGQYIQQDPIGLAGGNPTSYAYVRDPNTWIDPLGLRCKKTSHTSDSRSGAYNQAKRDAGVPRSQQPHQVNRVDLLDSNGKIIMRNGQPAQAREYHFTNNQGQRVVIQEHSWGHIKGAQSPHFNVRPFGEPNGYFPGTHGHYRYPGIIRG